MPLLIIFCLFCSVVSRRDEDYERTFGGKTIAAGLTIRVTPTDDLSSPPEVEVSPEVEAELVKDEVRARCVTGCEGNPVGKNSFFAVSVVRALVVGIDRAEQLAHELERQLRHV